MTISGALVEIAIERAPPRRARHQHAPNGPCATAEVCFWLRVIKTTELVDVLNHIFLL